MGDIEPIKNSGTNSIDDESIGIVSYDSFQSLVEHTLFINLLERKDRLEHIQKEMKRLGILTHQRVNAIKMPLSVLGCTLSHINCLERAKKEGWKNVFVCEDDAVFTNIPLLQHNVNKWIQSKNTWDVLIIGGNNQEPFSRLAPDIPAIQVHNCQTTTAYIVQQHYYDRLIQNFKESAANLMRYPQLKHLFAVDIYWKKLQITDNWFMTIPATVSQLEGHSDIEGHVISYNAMMLDYEKIFMKLIPVTGSVESVSMNMGSMNYNIGLGISMKSQTVLPKPMNIMS